MDTATANLSNQVFGLGSRKTDASRSQAGGITETLTIYTWPRNYELSSESQILFLAIFAAYGRSDSQSPSQWSTWAFTYITLAFPEMQDLIRSRNDLEYTFVPFTKEYVNSMIALGRAAEDYEDDDQYGAVLREVPVLSKLPSLERTIPNFRPDLAATATIPAVYGYVALLIFLAGKRITTKNASTITEKRPQNLVKAYKIPEESSFSLIGEGKMSTQAHQNINQAWVTHAPVRIAIISEVARFASGASLPQRVVYTLTKMMENAGMQQAYYIHVFLQAMPESVNFSCIRPSFNAYVLSLREVAAAPVYLQPYYKVIHGEQTRAFHRNSLLTLSACALAYSRYTAPTLQNFNLGDGAAAAVSMYDAEAARLGHPTLQNLTTKETNEDPEA